jgi:hypothetical protein
MNKTDLISSCSVNMIYTRFLILLPLPFCCCLVGCIDALSFRQTGTNTWVCRISL